MEYIFIQAESSCLARIVFYAIFADFDGLLLLYEAGWTVGWIDAEGCGSGYLVPSVHAGSLSGFGGSRRRSGGMVPIFRKFAANSQLFNKNLRKSGAIAPLLRPIHPKPDRLPDDRLLPI